MNDRRAWPMSDLQTGISRRMAARALAGMMGGLSGSAAPDMTNAELEKKARRIEHLLETRIVQRHGLIPMFVRASD